MPTDANLNNMAHAGKTLLELLFEQADHKYADLMELVEGDVNYKTEDISGVFLALDPESTTATDVAGAIVKACELRGVLRGLSFALAFFRSGNVETADVQAIRDELQERWEDGD